MIPGTKGDLVLLYEVADVSVANIAIGLLEERPDCGEYVSRLHTRLDVDWSRLTDITRGWLADMNAAPGHFHVTDSNSEAMPTESGVGTYKADYLAFIQSLGITIWAAYGNASTAIYAYEQAGIDKSRTFVVGSNAGESGTVDLGDDYQSHLQDIASEPAVEQPFEF